MWQMPKLLGSRIQEQYGSCVDLCIDHHVSNVPYAKARLLDGTASAVCEILYACARVAGSDNGQHCSVPVYRHGNGYRLFFSMITPVRKPTVRWRH